MVTVDIFHFLLNEPIAIRQKRIVVIVSFYAYGMEINTVKAQALIRIINLQSGWSNKKIPLYKIVQHYTTCISM